MVTAAAYQSPRERRLHVVEMDGPRLRKGLSPRAPGDSVKEYFLCGRCSIIFASTEERTILSGDAAVCGNCGAWNRL
jgi:hypothetical protein